MSWGSPSTAGANSVSTTDAQPKMATLQPPMEAPLCFACSRCEYPICTGSDILLSEVPGGTTQYAFHYNLDYLLDLDDDVSVPCYCGDETVDTAIVVSEKLLEEPLPPAARVMGMEAVIESRKYLKEQQTATLSKLLHKPPAHKNDEQNGTPAAPTAGAAAAPVGGASRDEHEGSPSRAPDHSPGRSTASATPLTTTMPRRRASGATLGNVQQAGASDEGVVGPEHDMQLVESIPEHRVGDGNDQPDAAPPPRPTATGQEEEGNTLLAAPENEEPVGQAPRTHDAENAARDAARTERVRALLATSRALRPVRRYGATSEARVDMVCITHEVLGYGLAISHRDRSAAALPAQSTSDGGQGGDNGGSRIPQNIIDAASHAPPSTHWGPPGNLTVEEAFMVVTRATSSAQGQWFSRYTCEERVECPDCHLPLGFLFEMKKKNGDSSGGVAEKVPKEGDPTIHRSDQLPPGPVPVFASLANERRREGIPEGDTDHHHGGNADTGDNEEGRKRAKTEGELGRAATSEGNRDEPDHTDAFPSVFIGLELKRIKQVEWGLRQFQERYARAQSLRSFRALFPEAEELQSLYNRLAALRTQAELYNNLLRKHKEQNEVQTSLLASQKDRLNTFEEKLSTMQQIIAAQKLQLEMQSAQLRQQDELLDGNRKQVATQAQQIKVEQTLLTEQSRTIETQREQIRLMRAHINVQSERTRLMEQQHRVDAAGTSSPSQEGIPRDTDSVAAVVPDAAEQEADERHSPLSPPITEASQAEPATASRPSAAVLRDSAASVLRARQLLAATERTLAQKQAALAALREAQGHASPSRNTPPTTEATSAPAPTTQTQPPAHLRGVYGTAPTLQKPSSAPTPHPDTETNVSEPSREEEK